MSKNLKKWKRNSELILVGLAIAASPSCGMKKRSEGTVVTSFRNSSQAGTWPDVIYLSNDSHILVRPSTIIVAEYGDSVVHYRVVNDQLLSFGQPRVTVNFILPKQTEMGVIEAAARWNSNGELDVTYPIPHGGDYEARLTFHLSGTKQATVIHPLSATRPVSQLAGTP